MRSYFSRKKKNKPPETKDIEQNKYEIQPGTSIAETRKKFYGNYSHHHSTNPSSPETPGLSIPSHLLLPTLTPFAPLPSSYICIKSGTSSTCQEVDTRPHRGHFSILEQEASLLLSKSLTRSGNLELAVMTYGVNLTLATCGK